MVSPDETSAIEPHQPLLVAIERAGLGLAGRRTARGRAWLPALALLVLALGGCTQLGPSLVKAGRNDYNVAVQQTNDEQVLLNVVRMRYSDNPLWLNVGSVTTQFNFAQGVSGGLDRDVDVLRYGWRVGADVRYSETPTISYSPLKGEQFVRNIMAPMNFRTFMLLANAGWDIERLMRLTVSRINGLGNAPAAEGPTPRTAPPYAEFQRAARLLGTLQSSGAIRFRHQEPATRTRPGLFFQPDALDSPEARELRALLGLEVTKRVYDLHILADKPSADSIGIELRSLVEMLNFLSISVEVPARDEEAGRVTVTRDASGQRFDWSRMMDGLFRVRSQGEQPTDAVVAVQYRGAWFFIDDRDIDSKDTFRLLNQVGSILAGETEPSQAPVLTLPVGGG